MRLKRGRSQHPYTTPQQVNMNYSAAQGLLHHIYNLLLGGALCRASVDSDSSFRVAVRRQSLHVDLRWL